MQITSVETAPTSYLQTPSRPFGLISGGQSGRPSPDACGLLLEMVGLGRGWADSGISITLPGRQISSGFRREL